MALGVLYIATESTDVVISPLVDPHAVAPPNGIAADSTDIGIAPLVDPPAVAPPNGIAADSTDIGSAPLVDPRAVGLRGASAQTVSGLWASCPGRRP